MLVVRLSCSAGMLARIEVIEAKPARKLGGVLDDENAGHDGGQRGGLAEGCFS